MKNKKEIQIRNSTVTIKARPMADGRVKAKTGDATTQAVYNGWYSAVYEPTAAASSTTTSTTTSK